MKKILFLFLMISFIFMSSCAKEFGFKADFLKRVDALSGKFNMKVKIKDDSDSLAFAIVPKKPVFEGAALLKIWEVSRVYRQKKNKFIRSGEISEKETAYFYDSLYEDGSNMILGVVRTVQEKQYGPEKTETKKKNLLRINVSLSGKKIKRGKLLLPYVAEFGNQANSNGNYRINFTLIKPIRILARISK